MPRHRSTSDAAQRSLRTLVAGLLTDLLIAAAVTTGATIATWNGDDVLARESWLILAAALGKSLLTAAASYIIRVLKPPKEQTP